ncbi:hypothetical protein [Streptomyces canus]|uniref:hypothetical protein n=1 Tax=Streptomyces canus TaxID=58343 RepID=UPI003CF9A66A
MQGSPAFRPHAVHSTVRSCFIVGMGGGFGFDPPARLVFRRGCGTERTAFFGGSVSTMPSARVTVTGPAGGVL